MENPGENKRPRLENSDIQREIKDIDKSVQETKQTIEESLSHLREMIDELEMNTAYLQHLENDRSLAELEKEIMGTEGKSKYSPEDMAKVKKEIEDAEREVREFQGLIDVLTLQNIEFEALNDEFRKLQDELNAVILLVDKAQLN